MPAHSRWRIFPVLDLEENPDRRPGADQLKNAARQAMKTKHTAHRTRWRRMADLIPRNYQKQLACPSSKA